MYIISLRSIKILCLLLPSSLYSERDRDTSCSSVYLHFHPLPLFLRYTSTRFLTLDMSADDEMKEAFALFGKDEQHISDKDLGPVLRSIGLTPTEADLKEALTSLRIDSTGQLDFAQFSAVAERMPRPMGSDEAELREAFQVRISF